VNDENPVDAQKYYHEENLELFRSIITFGQGAIKTLFLLNAGAVVVLLAFITQVAKDHPAKVSEFSTSVYPFALGVFLATVVALLAYFCQLLYGFRREKSYQAGVALHVICIIFACLSLGCFMWGLSITHCNLKNYG
jgi:hypothetical protein